MSQHPGVLVVQLPKVDAEIEPYVQNIWAFDALRATHDDGSAAK